MKLTVWISAIFFSILQISLHPKDNVTGEFQGVFMESYEEKIFFACDATPGAPGWWVRFSSGVGSGDFRYNVAGPGFPTRSHYMRVRGSLNGKGPYGTGFHTHEIVIDSVLEVSDSIKCESNFALVPKPWNGAGMFGRFPTSAATSDDRKFVAVADSRGMVSVWRSESGDLVGRYRYAQPSPPGAIPTTTIAFSPSDELMAVATEDGWVLVWNIPEGRFKWKLDHAAHTDTLGAEGQEGWKIYGRAHVGSMAFASDDSTLATAGGERARVWSMKTGRKISELLGIGRHQGVEPSQIVMLHNPERIVGFARDGTLRVYGPRGGPPLLVAPAPTLTHIEAPMKASPDGMRIALRVSQDSIALWSMEDGKITGRLGVPTFFQDDIAFSPDSKQVAMSGSHYAIYIWNVKTSTPVARVQLQHAGARNFWFTQAGDSLVIRGWSDSTLLAIPTKYPYDRLNRLNPGS